jgi:LysM repeat protein
VRLAQQYIVQRGDDLGKIARVHGITLARILELNPQLRAHPNLIRVGERVRVK